LGTTVHEVKYEPRITLDDSEDEIEIGDSLYLEGSCLFEEGFLNRGVTEACGCILWMQ